MSLKKRSRQAWPLALLLFLAVPPTTSAGVVQVNSPGEVGGSHFSDWGAAGPLDTYIPGPFTVTASGGERITLSSVSRVNNDPPIVDGFFYHLLLNTSGPPALTATTVAGFGFAETDVVFAFDQPVQAFGADMQGFAAYLGARVYMEALDATGIRLGVFTLAASPTDTTPAGFAGYAGVLSDTANISRVRYFAYAGYTGDPHVGLATIDVISVDIAAGPQAVPEPSSLALLVASLASIGAFSWSRGRKAATQPRA